MASSQLTEDLTQFFDQLNELLGDSSFRAWAASHKSGMHWGCCDESGTCKVKQLLDAMIIPNWREYVPSIPR